MAAALIAAAAAAQAQQADTRLDYRSAFEGYRPHGETELKDWRAANDTVRAIGGWRTYAREAAAPDAMPAAPPPAAPDAAPPQAPAAADPHTGHRR